MMTSAANLGADVFRFAMLAVLALFLGGAARLVYTYRKRPPQLSPEQRRRFVFGAMAGGTLLVLGFGINVLTRQDKALAPGTPIGALGLLVVLLTVYVLLWYGRAPPDKESR